jgi:hypothetical protein
MIDNMQTRASLMRVALVTSAELPELDSESRALVGPLAERGVSAVPRVWNDPTVDWTSVDLAVIRRTQGRSRGDQATPGGVPA